MESSLMAGECGNNDSKERLCCPFYMGYQLYFRWTILYEAQVRENC